MTQPEKTKITDDIVGIIQLQGEPIGLLAVRSACLGLLEDDAWKEYPTKRGEQIEYLARLAIAVLEKLGQAPPEQQIHSIPDVGGWDEGDGTAPPIIRRPIND